MEVNLGVHPPEVRRTTVLFVSGVMKRFGLISKVCFDIPRADLESIDLLLAVLEVSCDGMSPRYRFAFSQNLIYRIAQHVPGVPPWYLELLKALTQRGLDPDSTETLPSHVEYTLYVHRKPQRYSVHFAVPYDFDYTYDHLPGAIGWFLTAWQRPAFRNTICWRSYMHNKPIALLMLDSGSHNVIFWYLFLCDDAPKWIQAAVKKAYSRVRGSNPRPSD